MTTQETKVDWSRPIKAVHEDGRVEPVEPTTLPSQNGMHYAGRVGAAKFGFAKDGYPLSALCPWRIRNVAQPEAPTPSPDLTARMVDIIKLAAAGYHVAPEARAIVAEMEPEDGDLIEARKLCSVEASRMGDTGLAMEYLNGVLDDQFEMKVARRALERGEAK